MIIDIVEIISCFDGLLWINGIFEVLIKWIITVWDIIPYANQPVWNNVDFSIVLNFIITHNAKKHSKSNIVLIVPNINMFFFISLVFHFFGFNKYSVSTLSNGIPICAKSFSKFCINMCTGSIGKNGRTKLAIIIESIFPKFPLVAIFIYFNIFVNVFLPIITPFSSTFKSFSSRIMSAVSLAISTAVSTDIPTSDCFNGGLSFIPSPM